MRKPNTTKIFSLVFILFILTFTGCSGQSDALPDGGSAAVTVRRDSQIEEEIAQTTEQSPDGVSQTDGETTDKVNTGENNAQPVITEADWSAYFDGLNGTAVVYDTAENRYLIYQYEAATARRSPCSTFKIISSLIGLENGMIDTENSVRTWSGETFWNGEWNRDIDFTDAFHSSCVWYFREVVDEIGRERIQEELDKLEYGNCDISDWEGRLNTNNNNRSLTGFWIESSLKISPKEQAEVMERIFGEHTDYSEETLNRLKEVMLTSEQSEEGISVYGKTGTGIISGTVMDAWFTGFADSADKRIYFCVHLGETDDPNVSGAAARKIAVRIVADYLK